MILACELIVLARAQRDLTRAELKLELSQEGSKFGLLTSLENVASDENLYLDLLFSNLNIRYKADRGAHVYWLEKGTVDVRPDHILNLIHYEVVISFVGICSSQCCFSCAMKY